MSAPPGHQHRHQDAADPVQSVPGVTRVTLPIGVNAVESVNMYVLADGDKVTIVDCGVWISPTAGSARSSRAWKAPVTPSVTSRGWW